MERAWSATCPDGPMMDMFANAVESVINREVEPPFGCEIELVADFVERCDKIFETLFYDNNNVTVADIDKAVSEIDLCEFYDLVSEEE